jgi:hypothetical protein
VSAIAHYPDQTITIGGGGFGNTVPLVTLDNAQLVVTSHTPTSIEANLPVDLSAGSYHLSVRTGSGSGLLDMTLGEVGPCGSTRTYWTAGTAGCNWTAGPNGAAGTNRTKRSNWGTRTNWTAGAQRSQRRSRGARSKRGYLGLP